MAKKFNKVEFLKGIAEAHEVFDGSPKWKLVKSYGAVPDPEVVEQMNGKQLYGPMAKFEVDGQVYLRPIVNRDAAIEIALEDAEIGLFVCKDGFTAPNGKVIKPGAIGTRVFCPSLQA